MRVRFNRELPNAVFKHKNITLEFRTADAADLQAWYKRGGLDLPADSIYTDENGNTRIDRNKLDMETARKLEIDDDKFIGSRIVSIDGIEDEDGNPIAADDIDRDMRGELILGLREGIAEFDAWCLIFIEGAKKKSGRVDFVD